MTSFKEKEDTFHDICKALKELRDLKKGPGDDPKNDLNASGEHQKETINKDNSEPVIDITGEDTQGGTSSNLYRCETCGYKSSIEKRLRQHKKSKHASEIIPCELCDYKGNPEEYNVHVKSKHNKNKESSTEHRKEPNVGGVKIPCDMCEFVSTSTSSYIKHIESKHQTKKKEIFEDYCLSCDKCDFKTATEKEFKNHLETIHRLKVKETLTGTRKNNTGKLCMYWNRGHCSFGQKCKNVHEEIPPCRFQMRCNRPDCKYWHEPGTGKFPFLGPLRFPQPPQIGRFARPNHF